jgi:hypothetical protein
VRPYLSLFALGILLIGTDGCHQHDQGPRSQSSFDEICETVAGKSAAEVEVLLGAPDSREEIPIGDQRWIWWDYTFLDGESYSPEIRGKTVHLEITFSSPIGPTRASTPASQWKVSSPLAVSYVLAQP